MKIFITGATGFLGGYLISELAQKYETIYILTRNIDSTAFLSYKNIKLVKGDITNPGIFENAKESEEIFQSVEYVIHAAALYDMTAAHAECYLQNVVGTQNIIRLLKKMKSIKAFYYISTIAVGDEETYLLEEDQLPIRKKFNDYYSETKYYAEKMVRDAFLNEKEDQRILTRIIRPGIIIGDTKTGEMNKVDGPYYFLRAMKKFSSVLKVIPFLPLSYAPRTKIPIIPVDHCAQMIALIILREDFNNELKSYHLISAEIPSVKEFLIDTNNALKIKTKYIPMQRNGIHNFLLDTIGVPSELVPFMFSKLSYSKTRTDRELPELKESIYNNYKDKLFKSIT